MISRQLVTYLTVAESLSHPATISLREAVGENEIKGPWKGLVPWGLGSPLLAAAGPAVCGAFALLVFHCTQCYWRE